MALDDEVRCLHQVFKSESKSKVGNAFRPVEWGNCDDCTYDAVNNQYCKGYYAIRLRVFNVLGKDVRMREDFKDNYRKD